MKRMTIKPEIAAIPEVIDMLDKELGKGKIKSKEQIKAKLTVEEILADCIENETAKSDIQVTIHKNLWKTEVAIHFKGEEYKLEDQMRASDIPIDMSELDDVNEGAIRDMLYKALYDRMRATFKNGHNKIVVSVHESSRKNLIFCAAALALAIVVGFGLRFFVSREICDFINVKILSSVSNMFIKALKMVMIPIIFCSISSCMGAFSDMRDFGRIGAKVILFYLFTTVVAISLAMGLSAIFSPGAFGEFIGLTAATQIVDTPTISLVDLVVGIIPQNIVAAFYEADTLQVIFVAIIIGIAATLLGKNSEKVFDALNTANELFMKVAEMITRLLPVMIFSSACSLILRTDAENIKSIGKVLALAICACMSMLLFYLIFSMIKLRIRPSLLFEKLVPAWVNAFSLSSSNAAMPFTMQVCKQSLGIAPKIFSFSIPLGATINMDGLSVGLTVTILFLLKVFGIDMGFSDYLTIVVLVVALSMGTPGLPGVGIMCLTVLASHFGIPAEGVGLVAAIPMLMDPVSTANNVMGDIVGTMIVAKSEGLIDETVLRSVSE